ncbi:MAG: small subunit ribosomal protein S20 [Planctomycetota bacterium]|jgi:small subunit ribosomal protein S20
MPNTKQAKKRMETDEVRRLANKAKTSTMRTAVKKVMQAENAADAKAAMPEAMRAVDMCAKKNIIHGKAAARKKAQISRAVQAS